MANLPNFKTFLAPHKTAPKQKTPQEADDNWRSLEMFLSSQKPPAAGVTAGQIGVQAFPGTVGGTTYLPLSGQAGLRAWLITDAEGDSDQWFGDGWVSIVGASGLLSSAVVVGAPSFSGASSLTVDQLRLGAVNPAGTNAHIWNYTGPTSISSGGSLTPTAAQWSTFGTPVGTDLSLDSSGRIVTTAGGIYLVGVWCHIDYTGAVFDV